MQSVEHLKEKAQYRFSKSHLCPHRLKVRCVFLHRCKDQLKVLSVWAQMNKALNQIDDPSLYFCFYTTIIILKFCRTEHFKPVI